jgi:ABC-type thiamine transport system ATPase subunit
MAGNVTLSPAQRRCVVALLTAGGAGQAAATAGVSVRTVRRWLADPAFTTAIRDEARASARQALSALLAAQTAAVRVLHRLLDDQSPSTRLRAAVAVLEHGRHAIDFDVDRRLEQVERRLDEWPMYDAGSSGSTPLRSA